MKFYLSSFRLGNEPAKLADMFTGNKTVGVIVNALDDAEPGNRNEKLDAEIAWLSALGLQPIELDLRKYFKIPDINDKLMSLNGIWLRGGNSFTLRKAMKLSGLDKWIINNISNEQFVYAGYSAGVVVLQKDLKGIELVDPVDLKIDGYPDEVIWEGLGLLEYNVAVHYRSDHPESHLIENVVNLWREEGKELRTLKDGEVIIFERS